MGQNARVEHVGIRQHNIAGLADGSSGACRCVAVKRVEFDSFAGGPRQGVQLLILILSQRFSREKVERTSLWVFKNGA